MKKFRYILIAAPLLVIAGAFSFSNSAIAGIIPPFGGEYINLFGSGNAATFHTGERCNTNSGTCNGTFVMRTVCDGRVTNCDASHGARVISESTGTSQTIGTPASVGCNKSVQIDVFNKQCRDAAGMWICGGEIPEDYMVWYSGTCAAPTAIPTPPVVAACPHGSTQARLQKNLSDPWESSKTINAGEQIRVGGFHNDTGLLAGDVNLNVTGPANFSNLANGGFVTPTVGGTFTLTVTTQNSSGAACEDRATFQVQAAVVQPTPTAPPAQPTPTVAPQVTPTPTVAVQVTPTPPAAVNQPCEPGFAGVISGSQIICLPINNVNNNDNRNNINITATGGNATNTTNVTQNANPEINVRQQPQVLGASVAVPQVAQLPKTGLPMAAWLLSGLLPGGFGLRRLTGKKSADNSDSENFIWQKREWDRE